MMMKSNILLTLVLLWVGAANAAPTEVEQRLAYTSSLNAMVSVAMNWYDSLVDSDTPALFDTSVAKWADYRSHYPHTISHIEISDTDLIKLADDHSYQLTIKTVISYHDDNGDHGQKLTEQFVFDVPFLAKPTLKTISREQIESTKIQTQAELNSNYFKVRQFSYAWLAYLDGVTNMTAFMNADQWLDKASYSLKTGNVDVTDSVSSLLQQRKQFLTKGGHKLRSVEVQQDAEMENQFILQLMIEWKGENASGKPAIAKVQQDIVIQVSDSGTWEVLSIKEQHLIPDLKPWQGYLC